MHFGGTQPIEELPDTVLQTFFGQEKRSRGFLGGLFLALADQPLVLIDESLGEVNQLQTQRVRMNSPIYIKYAVSLHNQGSLSEVEDLAPLRMQPEHSAVLDDLISPKYNALGRRQLLKINLAVRALDMTQEVVSLGTVI